MSEAMDEQDVLPAEDAQSAPEAPRKRVITVRARGVTPTGPDEISREQFEELGADKHRVIEFVRQRDLQQGAANAEI